MERGKKKEKIPITENRLLAAAYYVQQQWDVCDITLAAIPLGQCLVHETQKAKTLPPRVEMVLFFIFIFILVLFCFVLLVFFCWNRPWQLRSVYRGRANGLQV